MRVAVLVALGLTGACLQPDLVPCGELSCAADQVCAAGGCADPANVAACEGLADGTACKTSTSVDGTCVGGSCQTGLCGNGRIDPGEICDGTAGVNAAVGEQCSADCQHVEVCGNGIVDPGEQCDDANANPADGCDACTSTTWIATATISGNVLATQIGLSEPAGIAVDRLGNVYIADMYDNRIRRIDPSGVVTIIAGNGGYGDNGDGGLATSAQLQSPSDVVVDGLGDIFIADQTSNRVRRISPDGIITTVAGNGTPGFSGDGGAATGAQLNAPKSVAVDGLGNLYIADAFNSRIRRVDVDGLISTITGNGTQGFTGDNGLAINAEIDNPVGITLDGHGAVYFTDIQRVRRIDANGIITTIAGTGALGFSGDGGPATLATFWGPRGIAIDELGDIYIAESDNQRVRRIDSNGIITTFAGNDGSGYNGDGGLATSATLCDPSGVAVDDAGNVYIADTDNERVRRVSSGIITTIAGTGAFGFIGDGGAATSAELQRLAGIVVDGSGNLYIADSENDRVRRVSPDGVITTVVGDGTNGSLGDGGPATSAEVSTPSDVALDATGNRYIADFDNARVRRIDASGIITTVAGNGTFGNSGDHGPATSAELDTPDRLVFDAAGDLLILDSNNDNVRRVDPGGTITTVAGNGTLGFSGDNGPATGAQLSLPDGLAVDPAGNIYIADTGNHRIRRVDTNGIITTFAGTGVGAFGGDTGLATSAKLRGPSGLLFANGNLYIADTGNARVRRIDSNGIITTIAGSGTFGTSGGDGGPAIAATLAGPTALAFDAAGRLYISDGAGDNVRRVDTSGVITSVAGAIDPQGMGPIAQARLGDPRALAVTPSITLFAGGSTGTVQAAFAATASVGVVAGRYPQVTPTGALARFRDQTFGTVAGLAYDASSGMVFLTESTSNRVDVVTIVDPNDVDTWTIAPLANAAGTPGRANGPAQSAQFLGPTGLYFDLATHQLYVADTGNHAVRAIDLTSGVAGATVRTIAGTVDTLGFFGDGGLASNALLYAPQAITRCANGDLFIADTGNNRIRRVAATTGLITTVLGDGVAASTGEGSPASSFPVDAPLGLVCDAVGNLFVTSTTTVRLVPADDTGIVDGTGSVHTIYGAPPRTTFPANLTSCLTGIAIVDATTVGIVDSCTGLLLELHRQPI